MIYSIFDLLFSFLGLFVFNEMVEWFSVGYFIMDFYVRRGCDDKFFLLGNKII